MSEIIDNPPPIPALETIARMTIMLAFLEKPLNSAQVQRHYPIGGFVFDYWIPDARLAIVLDGPMRDDPVHRALFAERTEVARENGFQLLLFQYRDVVYNTEHVFKQIKEIAEERIEKLDE